MNQAKGKKQHECVVCQSKFFVWKYRKSVKCCGYECYQKYKKTSEYRNALSKKHKGKIISDETRKKISEAQKGVRVGEKTTFGKETM